MCCSVDGSFILCVACLTVFANSLVKPFAMCLGVVAILLLNVMDVFSIGRGALLDGPCMVVQRMCVLCMWSQCVSKCSFHMFVYVFVCRKLSPHLRVWELDHRCLLSLYPALWYVILVYNQYDVCKDCVGSVYFGGYGGLSQSGLCVFRELFPVSFFIVGESPSVLL